MSVQRVRREFGAPVSFSDRNSGDVKDGYIECTPYEDKTFDLKRMELDKGIQVSSCSYLLFMFVCAACWQGTSENFVPSETFFAGRKFMRRLSCCVCRFDLIDLVMAWGKM